MNSDGILKPPFAKATEVARQVQDDDAVFRMKNNEVLNPSPTVKPKNKNSLELFRDYVLVIRTINTKKSNMISLHLDVLGWAKNDLQTNRDIVFKYYLGCFILCPH